MGRGTWMGMGVPGGLLSLPSLKFPGRWEELILSLQWEADGKSWHVLDPADAQGTMAAVIYEVASSHPSLFPSPQPPNHPGLNLQRPSAPKCARKDFGTKPIPLQLRRAWHFVEFFLWLICIFLDTFGQQEIPLNETPSLGLLSLCYLTWCLSDSA